MNLGFHTCFGDGSEIPGSYLEHIRDVMWKNMVFNRWELGDIVLIDNYWISHGRQVSVCMFKGCYALVGVVYVLMGVVYALMGMVYILMGVVSQQPYSGKRSVVVSWSKPYLKPSHRDNQRAIGD